MVLSLLTMSLPCPCQLFAGEATMAASPRGIGMGMATEAAFPFSRSTANSSSLMVLQALPIVGLLLVHHRNINKQIVVHSANRNC